MSGVVAACLMGSSQWVLTLDISNTVNPNIPALLSAAGWAGNAQAVRLVNNGLVNTLNIPSSLGGADLTLVNASGKLIGGVANGGTALTVRAAVKIDNQGTLAGGGGKGERGGDAWVSRTTPGGAFQYTAGAGDTAGDGQGFAPGSLTILSATAASGRSSGHLSPTGAFGGGSGRGAADAYGGRGGAGGAWGQPGIRDPSGVQGYGFVSGDYDNSGAGGNFGSSPAGKYIDGASYVTWINTGTRLGGIT